MTESTKFNEYVKKSILANNSYGITEVRNVKSIVSMYFDKRRYAEVERIIKSGNIESLKDLENTGNPVTEYLDVLQFADQNDVLYAVTAYDSSDLWQDPQVIDIFKLD